MSRIYKKTIHSNQIVDYVKCDKCGCETQFSLAIGSWAIIDGENYCMNCQKKYKLGWYENSK